MRTASRRVRGLLVLLVLGVSICWLLLRRRGAGTTPAVPAAGTGGGGNMVGRSDTGGAAAAQPAGLPAGDLPADVVATDAGLTVEPVAAAGGGATPAGSASEADDLRAIRGIGPSIERLLHGLDITTYRQIADLDGADLAGPGPDRVRGALADFRGRMRREDWVGQARQLHRLKYGAFPSESRPV